MLRSVRARLTLWYLVVLSLVLIPLSWGVAVLLSSSIYERIDTRLISTLQSVTAVLTRAEPENPEDIQTMTRKLESLQFPNQTIAILDSAGRLLFQRSAPGGPLLRLPRFEAIDKIESPRFYELEESKPDMDDSCRGVFQRVQHGESSDSSVVLVTESLEALTEQLELVQNLLLVFVPSTLVFAGTGGWLLVRRSLAPVVMMAERAQRISVENLNQRLPVSKSHDEFGHLASAFNALLDRLSDSICRQREFMADASHELRTPVSVIRTASGVTLQREHREEAEYREALRIVEQETRRLTRIVEDMFTLARADAGHPALRNTEFYLNELVADAARGAAVVAAGKSIRIETAILIDEAPFRGDEALLRQLIGNLLDNAIRHTPEHGTVSISLESQESHYLISVKDTGNGIPADIRPHIFERFYRGDKARSRAESTFGAGAGLGLPIARWIAEAHRGSLELQHSDETGSTFAASLPYL